MKTAREFYYSQYDYRDEIKSFQEDCGLEYDVNKNIYGYPKNKYDNIISEILSYELRFSNDYRLEKIIEEILSNLPQEQRHNIEQLFIVHTLDTQFSAFIKNHRNEFNGEIIFIDKGLSTKIINYSIILAYLLYAIYNYEKNPESVSQLTQSLNSLAKTEEKWKNHGQILETIEEAEIHINMPSFVRDISVLFFQASLSFIVAHEMSHYLLGHLDGIDKYTTMPNMVTFGDIITSPKNHQYEFHADLFAIHILFGGLNGSPTERRELDFTSNAFWGAQLFFTVLGQQENLTEDTITHPRTVHRYNICANLFKHFYNSQAYEVSVSLIRHFQAVLYETQGHGIGATINKKYFEKPWEPGT